MNENHQPDAELQSLLAALIDTEATPEQLAQLNQRLHADPAARALYVRTMSLHARLHAAHALPPVGDVALGSDMSVEAAHRPSRSVEASHHGRGRTALQRSARRAFEFFARPTPLSLAVATVFLASLLGLMALVAPPIYRVVAGSTGSGTTEPPVTVARITSSYDADWAGGQAGRHRGAPLNSGDKLELLGGFVEIAFDDGASVLLEGPARLVVDQVERDGKLVGVGRLQRGKLTAFVPPQAVGYTVRTPLVEVVDLGTEFGVEAAYDSTSVVVFQGKVAAHPATNRQDDVQLAIAKGEAMRFERSQPGGRSIPAGELQFVRLPTSAAPAEQDAYAAAVLADRPVGLWRLNDDAATLAVNRVGRPHGVYRGSVAQDAAPRPGEKSDGIAARFDGVKDYVEIAHDNALNARDFSIELWVQVAASPRDHASLVTSRDDRGITSGYMLYVTPQGNWELWTGSGSAWAIITGPTAKVGEWTHVVATFQRIRTLEGGSKVSGIGSLYINGQLAAENQNMTYIPQTTSTSPLRIGAGATEQPSPKYFFPGRIKDVAVYDTALTGAQIAQHFTAATSAAP